VNNVPVTFFGTVCDKGFIITELLLRKQILHEFVLDENFILSLQNIRDVSGFERIRLYLERCEYVVDFSF